MSNKPHTQTTSEPPTLEDFLGRWRVIAGDMRKREDNKPVPKHFAHIVEKKEPTTGEYQVELYYEEGDEFKPEPLQTLRFILETRTLENLEGEEPHRCISLWRRHGEKKRHIFAMRLKFSDGGVGPEVYPWEDGTDNGSWGAEDEPPLTPPDSVKNSG